MGHKDKQLLIDVVLTYLLLAVAGFLLKPDFFGNYPLILAGGLALGLAFGWYNRDKKIEGIKYLTDAAVLIVLAWISYRVIKSTFLYKDVIVIMIKGVMLLEIVFSFNFTAAGKIPYLRLLSVLVFMSTPIFTDAYNIPLGAVYLLLWLAVMRSQFMGYARFVVDKDRTRFLSHASSLFCFALAIFLAWLVASNVYLGRIREGQYLLEGDTVEIGTGGTRESDLADAFYGLQDQLQKKTTELTLKMDSNERKRQLIQQLSELVKETIKPKEMDKAEMGLVDILRRQGPGLEGAPQVLSLTRKYADLKNKREIEKRKEEIMDKLKEHSVGLLNKIKITSLTNKVQQSKDYPKLQENSNQLQEAIQQTPINQEAQQEISGLAQELTELKTLEFYRDKMEELEKKSQALGAEEKKNVGGLAEAIAHAEEPQDFAQALSRIEQLGEAAAKPSAELKDALKTAKGAVELRVSLLIPEQSDQIKAGGAQQPTEGKGGVSGPSPVPGQEENAQEESFNNQGLPEEGAPLKQKELKKILITPKSQEVAMGEEAKFSATGVYDDGSTSDLTALADWVSLNTGIARVDAGKVTSVSPGQTSTYAQVESVRSEYASIVVIGPRLISLTLTPQTIKIGPNDTAKLNVKGNYFDGSQRDLSLDANWVQQGKTAKLVRIEKAVLYPLRFGKTKVFAEFLQIRSNPASVEVRVTWEWIFSILIKIILFLWLLLLLIIALLYWLREKRRQEIEALKNNPREFIKALYINATALTSIFGITREPHMAPLHYAGMVHTKFMVPGNDFMDFSVKLEEARYSSHPIENPQMHSALHDYNQFFHKLLVQQTPWQRFYGHILTLIYRRPVFIMTAQLVQPKDEPKEQNDR